MCNALARHQSFLDQQRNSRQNLQNHRDRAHAKLEARFYEDMERGAARRTHLEARLTRAASKKEAVDRRKDNELQRQRVRNERRAEKREVALQRLQEHAMPIS